MEKLKFRIEQIAIFLPRSSHIGIAKDLLGLAGMDDWSQDEVVAVGKVFDAKYDGDNEGLLQFNYDSKIELELLHYIGGNNWMMSEREPCISHFGMHCSEEELEEWKKLFAGRSISIVQEVFTESHTNPVIKGKRKYHYTIFGTRQWIGVDLKFIVRIDLPQAEEGVNPAPPQGV